LTIGRPGGPTRLAGTLKGLTVTKLIPAACLVVAVIVASRTYDLVVLAARYNRNIQSVKVLDPGVVEGTELLQPDLYTPQPGTDSALHLTRGPTLLIVSTVACEPCRTAFRQLISELRPGPWRILFATAKAGPETAAEFAALKAKGVSAELLAIADPERYRSETGIVAVPSIIGITDGGTMTAYVAGIPSSAGFAWVNDGQFQQGSRLRLIDYQGPSQPLFVQPAVEGR
jgi:hypothetical protein